MILIAIDGSLCTASVCDKNKIVFCKDNSFFHALYTAFNSGSNFLSVFKVKKYVCNFCVELKINACSLQIRLHGQDQRLILIIFGEFQSTEIRKPCNMMDKSLEIKLHFQRTVPVFKGKHGPPVQPEG